MHADLPPSLASAHPDLPQIDLAIEQYRRGEPITARCPTCQEVLHITDLSESGSFWVTCNNGHVNYHARFSPQAAPRKPGVQH